MGQTMMMVKLAGDYKIYWDDTTPTLIMRVKLATTKISRVKSVLKPSLSPSQ